MRLFKWLDKFLGTPLCYLLGLGIRVQQLPRQPNRILVIKLVAMGDIIALLPALRAIKTRYPEAHITFLTTPAMRPLLQHSSDVDEVITLEPKVILRPGGFLRLVRKLRQNRFDSAIEMDHYYRLPSLLTHWAGIPHRVGFDISGQGRNLLLTTRVKYRDDLHAVENFARLAQAIGANIDHLKLIPLTFATAEADAKI